MRKKVVENMTSWAKTMQFIKDFLSDRIFRSCEIQALKKEAVDKTLEIGKNWYKGLGLKFGDIDTGYLIMQKFFSYNGHLHGCVTFAFILNRLQQKIEKIPGIGFFFKNWLVNRIVHIFLRIVLHLRLNKVRYLPGMVPPEVPLGKNEKNKWPDLTSCKKPVAVYIASMRNYLTVLLPVIEKTSAIGMNALIILPRAAKNWPNVSNLPDTATILYAEDLMSEDLSKRLTELTALYGEKLQNLKPEISRRFRVGGFDLWPYLEKNLSNLVITYMPYSIILNYIAEKLFEETSTKILIGARLRRTFECSFFYRAQLMKIITISIVHGVISSDPGYAFDDGFFNADNICVWGKNQELIIRDKPYNSGRVIITGNPIWDKDLSLCSQNTSEKSILRNKLLRHAAVQREELLQYPFWVLFAANMLPMEVFDSIQKSLADIPEAALFVKPHPSESSDTYQKSLHQKMKSRTHVFDGDSSISLHSIIRSADITLVHDSTALYDSLATGIPIIIVSTGRLANRPRKLPLIPEDYNIPHCRSYQQLAQVLQMFHQNKAYRSKVVEAGNYVLKDHVANSTSQSATEKILDLIKSEADIANKRVY